MALNRGQSISILYDLAMSMAGDPRARPMATLVLQRLMHHTGSGCGAILLNPAATEKEAVLAAEVFVAIGNPALRALEGKVTEWPAGLLAGKRELFGQDWFSGGGKERHAISLELPLLGCVLLFFNKAPAQAEEFRQLFAPIMVKFSNSLRHALDSEAKAQALEQSEARFRDLIESSPDWVWEVDAQGIYTFASRKIVAQLGYTPEEAIGKTPFDFMPQEEARRVGAIFADIAANKLPFFGLENANLHKQGHEVVLETSGIPILDAEGRLLGYRGIDRDITQRKRNEVALRKAKEAAEASSHAKSLFLSSMSHELRTPLNAILGHAQLISMADNLPHTAATSAQEIMQAGNILLSLINDVLELASIEAGEASMQLVPLSLADVLGKCIEQNADIARLRKTPLKCITVCTHCRVMADRHFLLQVLNQLVSNAVKFNREGGEVSISCHAQRNGRTRISVTDNGPGLSAEDQAQLFVPFNRLGAEKGQVEGAGVGLAIAQRLVEAMSGRIGVESRIGEGSTFWVELPAAASAEDAPPCHAPPENATSMAHAGSSRVLVADDYAPNQTILQMQLSALGCQADLAADGEVALKMWQEKPYDLILADLNMPVMDGLALARAVREREKGSGRHIPIICITAADQPAETAGCLSAGMDDVLTKPIALETLRDKIARWAAKERLPALAATQENRIDDAVLDLDSLYQILGATNPVQARALIATFIDAAHKGLAQLGQTASDEEIAREMHKQKSSARTVGALRYAKKAEALEKAAKRGEAANLAAGLGSLGEALADVEAAFAHLAPGAESPAQGQPLAGHGALLVVDDDAVVLRQMSAMLTTLGVKEVLTASNGPDALKLLSEKNGNLEALICDLNMPDMDGIEVIRLFGRTGYRGKLILMSGADEKVLSTAGKLAELQGLRVLGQVQKPVTPTHIVSLLSQPSGPRKRQRAAVSEVSPQSIRSGIDRDEFSVWFQPTVDAVSLKPVGVEALARWRHPTRGLLSPDAFIGVAEREGLVGELSQVLTSKALAEGAQLHAAGFPLTIAINLSGLWLDDLMLPDFIMATTLAARLRPENIILEVTETGVMKDLTTALDVLTRLRLKGFGLSIDDFGIGYSSFEQLDRIPFTELKLDRSFVSKGVGDATARAILQSSMDMARRMKLSTVAEGVESQADLELVRGLGCRHVQGHLIAKPMPVDDLVAWLRRAKNRAA